MAGPATSEETEQSRSASSQKDVEEAEQTTIAGSKRSRDTVELEELIDSGTSIPERTAASPSRVTLLDSPPPAKKICEGPSSPVTWDLDT